MAYTNSPLVSYTKLSPNHSGQRTHTIDRITPHCVVGQCSVETLGNIFYPTSRQASCQYGIGADGRVGMYVEEKNRSWCSSSNANDQRAITIECASDTTHPYAFKDVVYNKLIDLCVDICKRNGKNKLIWFENKDKTLNYSPKSGEMVLTVHRWFDNKSCPGDWLYNRLGDLAAKVNAKLGANTSSSTVKKGDTVSIASNATYYNGKSIPAWVKKKTWIVSEVSGDRVVVDKSSDGQNSICSPINTKYLTVASASTSSTFTAYRVKVTADCLRIRKGAGTNYAITGTITDHGVYTITAEKSGTGANKWGKLKSGAGWIALDYTKKV